MPLPLRLRGGMQPRKLLVQHGKLLAAPPLPPVVEDRSAKIILSVSGRIAQDLRLALELIDERLNPSEAVARLLLFQCNEFRESVEFVVFHAFASARSRANRTAAATAAKWARSIGSPISVVACSARAVGGSL
ncbi:hypothetical protein JSE7799_03390 [Jannaschia seosinensis]|uniref:Uncharacterized protein n=1 Tax=Jannaschia seosinensis TaxID=313367 RepID=A0A0M7BGZ1_9RHOB|nr:hypothetical protein JSE7799_03390 [Jannaschia seosinensis]